jgi:hypothetical protein
MTARSRVLTFLGILSAFTLAEAQPGPSITAINPVSALAGSPDFTLTVAGNNFAPGAVLLWGGASVNAVVSSATQLTAPISASLVASSGPVNVAVQNAAGARSNVVVFTVADSPISIMPTTLSAGIVGSPYSQAFTASGGRTPYRWGTIGTLPAGLSLNPNTGVLSGAPEARGAYTFTISVTDSTGTIGLRTYSFTVNIPPLVITTDSPVFNGTVGLFYSQTFLASGGIPPYRWAILNGDVPAGLAFDVNSGALTGTPSVTGTFSLTLQVTDTQAVKTSKTFQLTVDLPRLTIVTPSPLPNGLAGDGYSLKFSAGGGSAPYTWSLSGSASGLSLDSSTGVLSGTPSDPGTFSFMIQVKDASGASTNKAFTLFIAPLPLTITSATTLPDGAVSVPYSQTISATGGVPPYVWSVNGLPDGLALDPGTGVISGSPQAGGALAFTVRVTDSARASSTGLFHINISMPPLPGIIITGLPGTANAADQPSIGLQIATAYPVPLAGRLTLTFAPEIGPGDATIQFSTGGRTLDFTIPAGSTSAEFPVPAVSIQTGTVAGAITVGAQITASGVDITPDPQPSRTSTISRSAPVIASAKLVRSANGLTIQITGFSTAREVTQAVFHFSASPGSNLGQKDLTVAVDTMFSAWYQDAASVRYGSQFMYTQSFTIQGDATAVTPDSVTLSNRLGSTTALVK